jgi:hypothetical protein
VEYILKSLLSILLALGFLALDARAQAEGASTKVEAAPKKASIAFLGMAEGSDPLVSEAIVKRIRIEIGNDSGLISVAGEDVARLYAKGILRDPETRPEDAAALRREIGEAFLAYGKLERITVASRRKWWKPWAVKNTWTQGMRLHVVDGPRGQVVFDAVVAAAVPEAEFLFSPEEDWGKVAPLEREKRMRIMAEAVSVEAAKALAKAVKDRANPPAPAEPAAPGNPPATPG